MAIMAKKTGGGDFTPCPGGSHIAICVDVVDLGLVETSYSGKSKKVHKIRVVWQTGEKRDDGKPHYVGRRYTLSLHERSSLRKDLEAWRGRSFTEEELEGFDVERLLGAAALLSVVQQARDGSVYANINAIMRPPKGTSSPALDTTYVRVCNRPKDLASGAAGEPPAEPDWEPQDSDVPF